MNPLTVLVDLKTEEAYFKLIDVLWNAEYFEWHNYIKVLCFCY